MFSFSVEDDRELEEQQIRLERKTCAQEHRPENALLLEKNGLSTVGNRS